MTDLRRRRGDRPRPADRRARGRRVSPRPSCARTPGTRSTGSTCSATACSRCSPASSRRSPIAWRRSPAGSRAPRGARRRARAALVGDRGPARSAGSRPRRRSSSCPGIDELIDDALARRRAAPRPTPAVAALTPAARAAAATARAAHRRVRGPPARRRPARERGRGPPRPGAVRRRRCATRCAPRTLTPERILAAAEREYAAVRAEMVRLARDLWPAWCPDRPLPDDEGALVRGVLDADRRGASGGRRPARLLPRGERPDRGVLPRARPHRPRRRAARDPLDAGLPARRSAARCCRRRGRSTRARRRSSRSPRCPTTGPRSSASRTCARTTTGCSGC